MASSAHARYTIDSAKLASRLKDSSGPVGNMMRGFAGRATFHSRKVAEERTTPRTRRHIESIKSTTELSPAGIQVVTESITYGGAPEKATRPHVIRPRTAKVLRFPVGGMIVFARVVHHPGTRARNILRDGVRRAAHEMFRTSG